ncbi:hypothetical protein GCM10023185_19440 [Hymenobacter saemangeumensis]|uniref:Uncharacterized protein n=1 Tax=Hymenobacter saemangeumensis TaxID=1084522 RepID=A0ABP8ICR2_9BACT
MANARLLMSVRIMTHEETGRVLELSRPGKAPWWVELPAVLDQYENKTELVDYVTTQFLVSRPTESIQLGWETIYALVHMALAEAA